SRRACRRKCWHSVPEIGRLPVWPVLFPHLRVNGDLLLLLFHSSADDRKIIVKQTLAHTNCMKSSLGTLFLKATLLIVLFAWCLSRPTCAQAGGKDQFSPGPVRPGNLDYR